MVKGIVSVCSSKLISWLWNKRVAVQSVWARLSHDTEEQKIIIRDLTILSVFPSPLSKRKETRTPLGSVRSRDEHFLNSSPRKRTGEFGTSRLHHIQLFPSLSGWLDMASLYPVRAPPSLSLSEIPISPSLCLCLLEVLSWTVALCDYPNYLESQTTELQKYP